MKLAIFVFYDKDGIVYDYVPYYLKELKKVADNIDVIVNGKITDEGKGKLSKYARNIFVRENRGYDAGAYTEYFNDMSDPDEIKECEQIILANDTVFGPLTPLEKIFDEMSEKENDFWGIINQSRGAFSYIASFFLVFEKTIIRDGVLQAYFKENEELLKDGDYYDILSFFERGMYYYLKQRGYKDGSYCNIPYYDIFYSSDRCVIKEGFPFLKKKCLNTYMYGKLQLDMIMDHIKSDTGYDTGLIAKYLKEKEGTDYVPNQYTKEDAEDKLDHVVNLPLFDASEDEIIEYIKNNDKVYIYGAGYHARTFYYIYKGYMKEFGGFVVTRKKDPDMTFLDCPVTEAKDLPSNSAVLVALDRGNTNEVRQYLKVIGKQGYYLWR